MLAAAYRALFLASGGGALGLFTAIRRLRGVHQRIASDLEAASVPLYAQHVDAMGNATLIDVFRSEEDSCLLGTDAMRDGVDGAFVARISRSNSTRARSNSNAIPM